MIIDAHLHFAGDHPDACALLEDLDLKMINISVSRPDPGWRETETDVYRELVGRWPDRFAWCTAFDLPTTAQADPAWAQAVIEGLERDFADGAIACKVWKNIGMEIRDEAGAPIMVDAPVFEPVFEFLARRNATLLMHIGEPRACWRPIDEPSPHQAYYRSHPQWHMHGRDDVPSHDELMAARDRVVERHPELRVVGAHLGSLEYDLGELAARFEKYDNFAVDTSARLMDLVHHGPEAARKLIEDWPDRILFGTDIVSRAPHSEMSDTERAAHYDDVRTNYRTQHEYFATAGPVTRGERTFPGLDLPEDLVQKLFTDNARDWYPGL